MLQSLARAPWAPRLRTSGQRGVPVALLDIVPTELSAEESAGGADAGEPQVRNRFAQQGFERMTKAWPANLFARIRQS